MKLEEVQLGCVTEIHEAKEEDIQKGGRPKASIGVWCRNMLVP